MWIRQCARFVRLCRGNQRSSIHCRPRVCVLSVTVFSMNSILKLNFDSSFDTRRQPRIKQEVMCCEEMSWQKCNFTKRRDCNTKMCQNRNSQNASGKKLSVEERETGWKFSIATAVMHRNAVQYALGFKVSSMFSRAPVFLSIPTMGDKASTQIYAKWMVGPVLLSFVCVGCCRLPLVRIIVASHW